jgi:hypothetical protein
MERRIPMQDTKPPESQCHYPDCTSAAVNTCRKCHQSFCALHIHRRWWSYICDFCLELKEARRFHRPEPESGDVFHRGVDMPNVIDEVREKDDQEKIDELAD